MRVGPRLRAVAERNSEADWLDDPDLSSAIERLCREGANRRELLHARASLHYAGLLKVRPLSRSTGLDWKARLVRLLERPPVPAELRASASPASSPPGQPFLSFGREEALEIALEIPSMGGLILAMGERRCWLRGRPSTRCPKTVGGAGLRSYLMLIRRPPQMSSGGAISSRRHLGSYPLGHRSAPLPSYRVETGYGSSRTRSRGSTSSVRRATRPFRGPFGTRQIDW